jgi:hypothetical protein
VDSTAGPSAVARRGSDAASHDGLAVPDGGPVFGNVERILYTERRCFPAEKRSVPILGPWSLTTFGSTRGPHAAPEGPKTATEGDKTAGRWWWGGLDLNQRPTDYEFDSVTSTTCSDEQ